MSKEDYNMAYRFIKSKIENAKTDRERALWYERLRIKEMEYRKKGYKLPK